MSNPNTKREEAFLQDLVTLLRDYEVSALNTRSHQPIRVYFREVSEVELRLRYFSTIYPEDVLWPRIKYQRVVVSEEKEVTPDE